MKRLPLSPLHRQRLSDVRKGKPKSPEHRAKLSAAMKGRVFTEEHRRKLSERGGRPRKKTDAQLEFETLQRNRRAQEERSRQRIRQWNKDRRAARLTGDAGLLEDVKKSSGWWSKRRYRGFPGVSDGYSKQQGNVVVWSSWPYVRLARVPQKCKTAHNGFPLSRR